MTNRPTFVPTRSAGLARLAAFLPNAGKRYAAQRNTDEGPQSVAGAARQNVSLLSPYIRYRLLTEAETLAATLGQHTPAQADKFIAEVFWRAYFKGHLETRPQIWQRYHLELKRELDRLQAHAAMADRFHVATSGQTGMACFDDWVTELITTGYLHNHARMWFASIWVFTLDLPWQLGADFTFRHFVDGDAAANTLSWRWVAGLHTIGKTYLARADNIETYTQGRYRPSGLAAVARPLVEPPIGPARVVAPVPERPSPGRAALLLTDDDLNVESLDLKGLDVAGIALGTTVGNRGPLPVSPHVAAFVAGALEDTARRCIDRALGAPVILPQLSAGAVLAFAQAVGVDRIVMPYTPIGPTADAITLARPELARHGLSLEVVRRRYDSATWPHASRGFFALREQIPRLLDVVVPHRPVQGRLF